ncbi:MAG: mechanosensitive ion channel family protein [Deltaproteobacteria bacterium]|nr:mechanosensitive ion channel family protein [Deltaproteobacteria bacterium]MCW8892145.1 mechanosensitive ion channel family protein [Deltaproteobacteria bacterium]MCW9049032.1 mechanosensitive ion channel family protein [Deltaproteobacteria bacterium]
MEIFSPDNLMNLVRGGIIVVFGYLVAKLAARSLGKLLKKHTSSHQHVLLQRALFYVVLILFLITALKEMGFSLSVLLGAAGVLSVAIGFASQTSASNLISGLFLLFERPFGVGDVIRVGSTTGEVLSIDLLSAKLRTFDNLYVRIPNETMLKSEVTTLTKFPIRRLDLQIGVAYKENIEHVREVLSSVADKNPLSLEDPKPVFIFQGFGDSALNVQFSVWVKREKFIELKNSIQYEIKLAFDQNNIEIPFPHMTLYAGSVTEPFPIRMVPSPSAQPETQNIDAKEQP